SQIEQVNILMKFPEGKYNKSGDGKTR
ncbi:MAG: hypothetical protein ACI836_000755, partial [Saprospiraceae bacterium]